MSRYPYGQQKIIDGLQRDLDTIEKTWPMTGSYERLEPYIIPMMQADQWFNFIVYHLESKLWFDKSHVDFIITETASRQLIKPGQVAFDLGSNSGAITLPMAMLAGPEGHVHAFDPYPWNAAATKANARINHFDNVTAHAVGVSNATHKINVNPNDSRIYAADKGVSSQVLDIRHIGEYMSLKPNFIKMDIEGAEHELFLMDDANVYRGVQSIALEFHPMWLNPRGVDLKSVLRNIVRHGFDIHYYTLDSPLFDVDTLHDGHHIFWLKRDPSP